MTFAAMGSSSPLLPPEPRPGPLLVSRGGSILDSAWVDSTRHGTGSDDSRFFFMGTPILDPAARRPIPYLDSSWQYLAMVVTKQSARRMLLHLDDGRRVPPEPDEVFLLEADGHETEVRARGTRRVRSVR